MVDWVRLWHDMPTDPKWRVIARKSGQPIASVISVFVMMMTNASSNSEDRGTLDGWNHEDVAAALDLDEESVAAICDAMQGRVLDGDRLTGWERRQPKREDMGVAARVKKHRETRLEQAKRDVTHVTHGETQRNAPETETETETDTDTDTEKRERERARAPTPNFSRFAPAEWKPDPAIERMCRVQPGVDRDFELSQFRLHEFVNGKQDWDRAWAKWLNAARPRTRDSPGQTVTAETSKHPALVAERVARRSATMKIGEIL
jgi:hypothetical protein